MIKSHASLIGHGYLFNVFIFLDFFLQPYIKPLLVENILSTYIHFLVKVSLDLHLFDFFSSEQFCLWQYFYSQVEQKNQCLSSCRAQGPCSFVLKIVNHNSVNNLSRFFYVLKCKKIQDYSKIINFFPQEKVHFIITLLQKNNIEVIYIITKLKFGEEFSNSIEGML